MNRIKELREGKGVSLREMASSEEISVSATQLGKYENGNAEPRQAVRQELADYFGVSVNFLMGFDETQGLNPEEILAITRQYASKLYARMVHPEITEELTENKRRDAYASIIISEILATIKALESHQIDALGRFGELVQELRILAGIVDAQADIPPAKEEILFKDDPNHRKRVGYFSSVGRTMLAINEYIEKLKEKPVD